MVDHIVYVNAVVVLILHISNGNLFVGNEERYYMVLDSSPA